VLKGRFWAWAAAAAAILGICVATLHSGGGLTPLGWSFYLTFGNAALAELIANLILFIPLGVALTLAGVKPMRVIAAGAALSFTVEFLQQWIPGRDPSLGDIVANTNSTALGVLLVVAAPLWLFVSPGRSTRQALITAIIAVLVWWGTAWLLRQTAPPLPYNVVLNPDFRGFGHYNGPVIDVRPGKTGGRLEITALAATEPPNRTSPLIAILDKHGARVVMLSVVHASKYGANTWAGSGVAAIALVAPRTVLPITAAVATATRSRRCTMPETSRWSPAPGVMGAAMPRWASMRGTNAPTPAARLSASLRNGQAAATR